MLDQKICKICISNRHKINAEHALKHHPWAWHDDVRWKIGIILCPFDEQPGYVYSPNTMHVKEKGIPAWCKYAAEHIVSCQENVL